MSGRLARHFEEQMRRGSSRATEHLARRFGNHFPMWIGCGYPKSGTVWLCRLMSSYLGVPYPQNYALPIAMRSVVHAHWKYHPGLPRTAYILRDGRDVLVSLYFYNMNAVVERRHPRHATKLDERYRKAFGSHFDPLDVRSNLPRFIQLEMEDPSAARLSWPDHIRNWRVPERPRVTVVSYEALVADGVTALSTLMENLTDAPIDMERIKLTVDRFDFANTAGRRPGEEDRSNFLRKGVVGDWQNHFSREAGEVFDHHAGDLLAELGYVDTRRWYETLPVS